MDKSVCPEKNKRKSNETFGNENTTDNVCSTKNSLQSKIKRQKIDKESLDNEISDDDSDLEILVNLVGSYPNNDETPNSLKMTQSFQKVSQVLQEIISIYIQYIILKMFFKKCSK